MGVPPRPPLPQPTGQGGDLKLSDAIFSKAIGEVQVAQVTPDTDGSLNDLIPEDSKPENKMPNDCFGVVIFTGGRL